MLRSGRRVFQAVRTATECGVGVERRTVQWDWRRVTKANLG